MKARGGVSFFVWDYFGASFLWIDYVLDVRLRFASCLVHNNPRSQVLAG